ncbi:receptor-like protein EIX1 [Coffea eugenioides]|uniref:receptor-like protein EIX1 n=1 Tax=Coffea eugenioides TaxID=49369 RepID=UPI000F60B05A|nr:receptor-like protein EIX1 [Coffea eugenioides]
MNQIICHLGLEKAVVHGKGGHLSPSLVNLTNLRYLDLNSNSFSGIQVPAFLGLLKNLRYLNLSGAGFDGEIPRHLGNLMYLRYLDLGDSDISPVSNWLSTRDLGWVVELSSLEALVLSKVNLTAAQDGLQVINMLSSLTTLDLNGCDLFIHPHLSHVNFTSLSSLDLCENNFSNYMVPPWLCNFTGLHDLRLDHNNLSDPIHGLFDQMTSLVRLDLLYNCCDASTLKSLCNISSLTYLDLRDFDLSLNFLTGHIPQLEVGQTSVLQSLFLNDNRFTGTIPEDLCKLENLFLDLSNNLLSGRVPVCLGNLGDLRILNLANNSLSGQIPSSLGNLGSLYTLHLNGNKFVRKLPTSMQHLRYLEALDLGDNGLKDIIPAWIGERLSNLMFLRFQSNNFHGAISDTLYQLSHLRVLNLAHNNLVGFIPHCFNNISAMGSGLEGGYTFDSAVSLQDIKGGRELEYHSLSLLRVKSISLSTNNLVGEIPDGIMELVQLQVLNLSQNHLTEGSPRRLAT